MSSDVLMQMSDISGIGSPQADDDCNIQPTKVGISRVSLLPTATNGNGRTGDPGAKSNRVAGSLIPRAGAALRKNESTAEYIKRSLNDLDKTMKSKNSSASPPVTSGTSAPPTTAMPGSATHARNISSSASPPVSPIASVPASMYSPIGVVLPADSEPEPETETERAEVVVISGATVHRGMSNGTAGNHDHAVPSTPPSGRGPPPDYSYARTPPPNDCSSSSGAAGESTPSLSALLNNNYHSVAPAAPADAQPSRNGHGHGDAARPEFSTPSNPRARPGLSLGGQGVSSAVKGHMSFAGLQLAAANGAGLAGQQTVSVSLYEELKMHYQQLEASNQLLVLQNGELEQQCSSHIASILELESVRDAMEIRAERDQELLESETNDVQFLKSQLQFKNRTVEDLENDLDGILTKNKALTAELDQLTEESERREAEAANAAAVAVSATEAVEEIPGGAPSAQMVELEKIYSTLDLQYKRLKLQYNTLNEQNEAYLKQIEEFDNDNQALSAENISMQEQVNELEDQLQYQTELCAHAKEEAVLAMDYATGMSPTDAKNNSRTGKGSEDTDAQVLELQAQLQDKDSALRELNAKTNELYDAYEQEVSNIKLDNARKLSTFMILQRHRAAYGTRRSLFGSVPGAQSPNDSSISPRAGSWGAPGAVVMTVGTCWLKWKLVVVQSQREEINVKVTALEEFINHSLSSLQAETKVEGINGANGAHVPGTPGRGTPTRTFLCSQCSRSMTPGAVCEAISRSNSPTKTQNSTPLSVSTASPARLQPTTVSTGVNTDLFPMPAISMGNRDRTSSSSSTGSVANDLELLQYLPLSPGVDRSTLPVDASASKDGLRHRDVGASGQKQDPFGHKYSGKGLSSQMEAAGGEDKEKESVNPVADPRRPQRALIEDVTTEDYIFMIIIKVILLCLLLLITYYILDSTSQSTDSSENYYNRLVGICVNRDLETVEPISTTFSHFSPILTSLYENCAVLCNEAMKHFQTSAAVGGEIVDDATADVDIGAVITSVIRELDKLLSLCGEVHLRITS